MQNAAGRDTFHLTMLAIVRTSVSREKLPQMVFCMLKLVGLIRVVRVGIIILTYPLVSLPCRQSIATNSRNGHREAK